MTNKYDEARTYLRGDGRGTIGDVRKALDEAPEEVVYAMAVTVSSAPKDGGRPLLIIKNMTDEHALMLFESMADVLKEKIADENPIENNTSPVSENGQS